jgi:uncharacterized heparinase superfamily protein
LSGLARYFHTVRYLRPAQVTARLRLLLPRPRPDLRLPPPMRPQRNRYAPPIAPQATLVAPDVFRALAVERRFSRAAGWQPPGAEKLWLYNLHYFDDLNARDAQARHHWHVDLLNRWVAENPPGRGDGWEPYPVSRRIVNWVKWAAAGNPLPSACHASLAVQTRWLTRRLEYHLLGNHLLANAKALIHGGLYFEGSEAEAWYARGLRIAEEQLRTQVLADGGHFELSPMYHAAVLEDVLDLVNILHAHDRPVPADWAARIASMRRWLSIMTHPDGEIAFFNDAAFGVAPNAVDLDAYAERLGCPPAPAPVSAPVVALESSGYVRLAVGIAQMLCDCASVGPDSQPGHAHADTLSFELSLGGRRVFVNSGTSQYGTSAERHRQRATAAHNTVVVDGRDSSEVWGGFRVARRARVRSRHMSVGIPAVLEASHDGYRRLPGRNEHRRRWILDRGLLEITDFVSGEFSSAAAFFHVHPEIAVHAGGRGEVLLSLPEQGSARVAFDGATAVEVQRGSWHPRFGVAVANSCLKATWSGAPLTTRVTWTERQ